MFLDDECWEILLSSLLILVCNGSVFGLVLVVYEGVNGMISGLELVVDVVLDYLCVFLVLGDDYYVWFEVKCSWVNKLVFCCFKVWCKKEIVIIGVVSVDFSVSVGIYVEFEYWNVLMDDFDILVIDICNSYEMVIGMFEGVIDFSIESFCEFL